MILGFLFAKYVLKLSLLNNLGSLTGGMTSTPALGTLISTAGTEKVAAAYASTYPVALISVVIVSQLLLIIFQINDKNKTAVRLRFYFYCYFKCLVSSTVVPLTSIISGRLLSFLCFESHRQHQKLNAAIPSIITANDYSYKGADFERLKMQNSARTISRTAKTKF